MASSVPFASFTGDFDQAQTFRTDVLRRICKYESEMLKHAHDPTIREFFGTELAKLDVELMKYTKAIRSCCTGTASLPPPSDSGGNLLCPGLPANTLSCLSTPPMKSMHESSPPHVPPPSRSTPSSLHGHGHGHGHGHLHGYGHGHAPSHIDIGKPHHTLNSVAGRSTSHYSPSSHSQIFPAPNQGGDIKRAASTGVGVTGGDYPDRDFFPRASLTRSSTLTPSVHSFHSMQSETTATDVEGGSESRYSAASSFHNHHANGGPVPVSGDSANTTPVSVTGGQQRARNNFRSDLDPVLVHPQASVNVSRTLFASESDPVISGVATSPGPPALHGLLHRSASGHSHVSAPYSNDSRRSRSRTPIVGCELKMPPLSNGSRELKMPPLSNGSHVSHYSPRFSPVGTPVSSHRANGSELGFASTEGASNVPLGTSTSSGLGAAEHSTASHGAPMSDQYGGNTVVAATPPSRPYSSQPLPGIPSLPESIYEMSSRAPPTPQPYSQSTSIASQEAPVQPQNGDFPPLPTSSSRRSSVNPAAGAAAPHPSAVGNSTSHPTSSPALPPNASLPLPPPGSGAASDPANSSSAAAATAPVPPAVSRKRRDQPPAASASAAAAPQPRAFGAKTPGFAPAVARDCVQLFREVGKPIACPDFATRFEEFHGYAIDLRRLRLQTIDELIAGVTGVCVKVVDGVRSYVFSRHSQREVPRVTMARILALFEDPSLNGSRSLTSNQLNMLWQARYKGDPIQARKLGFANFADMMAAIPGVKSYQAGNDRGYKLAPVEEGMFNPRLNPSICANIIALFHSPNLKTPGLIPVADLVSLYQNVHHQPILLADYGFSTIEEVIACIPGVKRKRQKSTKKPVYIYDDTERKKLTKTVRAQVYAVFKRIPRISEMMFERLFKKLNDCAGLPLKALGVTSNRDFLIGTPRIRVLRIDGHWMYLFGNRLQSYPRLDEPTMVNILRTFESSPKIAAPKFCERFHKKFGHNAFNVEYKGFHDLDELMSSIPGVRVVVPAPAAATASGGAGAKAKAAGAGAKANSKAKASVKYFQCSPEHAAHLLKKAAGAGAKPPTGRSASVSSVKSKGGKVRKPPPQMNGVTTAKASENAWGVCPTLQPFPMAASTNISKQLLERLQSMFKIAEDIAVANFATMFTQLYRAELDPEEAGCSSVAELLSLYLGVTVVKIGDNMFYHLDKNTQLPASGEPVPKTPQSQGAPIRQRHPSAYSIGPVSASAISTSASPPSSSTGASSVQVQTKPSGAAPGTKGAVDPKVRGHLLRVMKKHPYCTLTFLCERYQEWHGTAIPFREFGFATLEDMLRTVPRLRLERNAKETRICHRDVMCYDYTQSGKCRCGLNCDGKQPQKTLTYRSAQCDRELTQSGCRWGDKCAFLHTRTSYTGHNHRR